MNPFAIKNVAVRAIITRAVALFCAAGLLVGCATPPSSLVPQRFDLGAVRAASGAAAPGVPVWLASVHAPSSLDGTAMVYRLGYSDTLQTRAYAQARWSMPIPELFEHRLRQHLSAQHAVLSPADGVQSRRQGVILRIELEDFSQAFLAPERASAQLRLRATLSAWRGGVEQLLAQRSFQAEQPCASADALGGVRALGEATDKVLVELGDWLDATSALKE